jgi:large subunit ribosomal protein L2
MGKRIRVQRRGRGGQNWRASTHKRVAPAKYPAIAPKESFEAFELVGIIVDLVHDPGRGSPLSLIEFDNGLSIYSITPEGVFTGQEIVYGGKATAEIGNILPLGKTPEGTLVCNIELRPGDGGKWRAVPAHTQPLSVTLHKAHDPFAFWQNTLC